MPRLRPFVSAHQQATEQRPWTTSSSTYGSYTPIASRSPFRNRPLIYEPPPSPVKHGVHTQLTSEDVGSFYSSFKPLARPRPASDTTIQMRNRAIKDGIVSSEAIGGHTGVSPRRHLVGGFGRPQPSLTQRFGVTSSSAVIGIHPTQRLDTSDTASLHYEANFARRFPWHPQGGQTSESAQALQFQNTWLDRAKQLHPLRPDLGAAPPRAPANEGMGPQPSGSRTSRSSQSALPVGDCSPNLDPRRGLIRPSELPYGSSLHGQPDHRIATPFGERSVLPPRATLGLGVGSPLEGKGRSLDF